MKEAAVLYSEKSGIEMRIFTNESGIQLYTGNYLSGGKDLNNLMEQMQVCVWKHSIAHLKKNRIKEFFILY